MPRPVGLLKSQFRFRADVPASQHEEHATFRTQLQDDVAFVVGRPEIVLRIDAQAVAGE